MPEIPSLTILIPTRNRSRFVARLLHYFRNVGCPFPIVVADSSSPSEAEATGRYVASFATDLDVGHVRFPDSGEISLVFTKIWRTLSTIDSRYAAVCADKEFLAPSGIQQCVQYLEAHPAYSLAHGRAAFLESPHPSNVTSDARTRTWLAPQRSVESGDPQTRLRDHLQNYTATAYSVHRRTDLMLNMRLAEEQRLDGRFGELLTSCMSMIQGKVRLLDTLYSVRPRRPDLSNSKQPGGRVGDWLAGDFSERYANLRSCLAAALVEATGMPLRDGKDSIDSAFEPFLARLLKMDTPSEGASRNRPFGRLASRTKGLAEILPDAARVALLDRRLARMIRAPRRAYDEMRAERVLRWKIRSKMGYMSTAQLMDQRSPYRNDFLPIYESVTRYPDGVTPSLPA